MNTNNNKVEQLLDTNEVSKILGLSCKSLANSRYKGCGLKIPYIKIGKLVRYKRSDIENYIEGHRFYHTGQQGGEV
jgi:predicted DNA-binding transcriptional regulator AlpA